jgi:uncharacterized membrane protein (Fun14 family)
VAIVVKEKPKKSSYDSPGVFFAALMYLGQQGIVNINWDKLQSISQGVLSMVTNTITTASSSLLPATTMMTNSWHSINW